MGRRGRFVIKQILADYAILNGVGAGVGGKFDHISVDTSDCILETNHSCTLVT